MMQRIAAFLLVVCVAIAALMSGLDVSVPDMGDAPAGRRAEAPAIALPLSMAEHNWLGRKGEGSCVWASFLVPLRWQGREHKAALLRAKYGDGEWPEHFSAELTREGVRHVYTAGQCDVAWLEWAIDTCRGCGVTIMGGAHMVTLVHLDSRYAGIVDPNREGVVSWWPRDRFLAEWCNSTSWAVAPLYTPAPPLPR